MDKNSMAKRILLLLVCLFITNSQSQSICPYSAQNDIIIGSLTASLSSLGSQSAIALNQSTQTTCYSYALTNPFTSEPSVTTSLSDFSSQASNSLYIAVKYVRKQSAGLNSFSFLIRTQWRYNQWNSFKFAFIAEQRNDIEVGMYQIDTGILAGCTTQKALQIFLPFRTNFTSNPTVQIFLTGFQMTSQLQSNSYSSPFEVQQQILSSNITGVVLSITVTSQTTINNLIYSYVAYDMGLSGKVVSSQILYSQYSNLQQINLKIESSSPIRSLFSGLSGFILTSNPSLPITFSASFSSTTYSFTSQQGFLYFTYSYFGLIGSQCTFCKNANYLYQGNCVTQCPQGTTVDYANGNCVSCNNGQKWNGTQCVTNCDGGRYYNATINACQCYQGQIWTGQYCIVCPNGQSFNYVMGQCQCNAGTNWNGLTCLSCNGDKIWNTLTLTCICPQGSNWNGSSCLTCMSTQTWNLLTLTCQCPSGTILNGQLCTSPTCSGGMVWSSTYLACQCSPGSTWNGTGCSVFCSYGRFWDSSIQACLCPNGQNFNGAACITCTNQRYWNLSLNACQCPSGTNWNLQSCIVCTNPRTWNAAINECQCPSGTIWSNSACVSVNSCTGGRSFNYTTNQCECPINYIWNNNNCAYSVCNGGRTFNVSVGMCQCPAGSNWNGVQCITCFDTSIWMPNTFTCLCPIGSNKVYNSSTNKCDCQSGYQLSASGICQVSFSCPSGTFQLAANSNQCVTYCPAGYYYSGPYCTNYNQSCPTEMYWNINQCSLISSGCPTGTVWSTSSGSCISTITTCPDTYYFNGSTCLPLSQRCPSQMYWINNMCIPQGNQCPNGTYYNGYQCVSYINTCANNMVWNATLVQCVCGSSTFWNGNTCVQCATGMVYTNDGCVCPTGMFYNGSNCAFSAQSYCANILNAQWNNTNCVCNPGYSSINGQCICYGLQISGWCNRCYQKPNSIYTNGYCLCNSGYYQINGLCVNSAPPANNSISVCSVSTYFDNLAKQCLKCTQGCLSCVDCYSCTQCIVGYNFNAGSGLCSQICGDAKRFTLQCDDGNNFNGDGCSYDCKVENGYTCNGGSPSTRDTCTNSLPVNVTFLQTGQSHLYGSIVLNVRVNYLPSNLTSLISQDNSCNSTCVQALNVSIVSGDKSFTSIVVKYIGGAYNSFSVQINFDKQPINTFGVQISINQNLKAKYFPGINTQNVLAVSVSPVFLALIQKKDYLA